MPNQEKVVVAFRCSPQEKKLLKLLAVRHSMTLKALVLALAMDQADTDEAELRGLPASPGGAFLAR
jgi:hypothetical protein